MSTVETLKQQEDENQIGWKKYPDNISFPNEIIQDILSRLPVKPILRFRSVAKQWLTLISDDDPCFQKLHFSRSLATSDRTSFFISADDTSTNERHFLSAPLDGGPVTHLITLRNVPRNSNTTEAEHLNGLVFFTSRDVPSIENFAFVVNPATRNVFKVPPPFLHQYSTYFFGFDESKNEHKILSINSTTSNLNTIKFEFMIFSLSTYSWRQIHVELPPDSDKIHLIKRSVCVNSAIHLMLRYEILVFDLTTEKFSIINHPQGAIPRQMGTRYSRQGKHTLKNNMPFLIKDNELLGLVCHDRVVETNEMHIWILQDYVNRVWVRETVKFPEYWIELDGLEITGYLDMADLVFSCHRLSRDIVKALILDMKTKSFNSVNFNLGYPFLQSNTVKFRQVRSYDESILPLRGEMSHGSPDAVEVSSSIW